jgi:predicted DNA-binding transcriptional regulator AlpA
VRPEGQDKSPENERIASADFGLRCAPCFINTANSMTVDLDRRLVDYTGADLRDLIRGEISIALSARPSAEPAPAEAHLLTGGEVCRRLSIGPTTLWQMRRKGVIIPIYLGRAVRFRAADVEALQKGGASLATTP